MFIKKKVIVKGKQDGKYKKEISKTWSGEAIDTLINCFHMSASGILPAVIKDQNRKSLPLEDFDMTVQEYNINRYDYNKME